MLEKYVEEFNKKGETYLKVKANPGMSKTEIKGILKIGDEEILKINIAAPPEKGRANLELIRFLAREFKAGKNKVNLISGAGDRIKLIKIKI